MLKISPTLSRQLNIVNFLGVLMVLGIHSKPPTPVIPGSLDNWIYEISCNGIFRSAVPLLFMVSGLLYFRDVRHPWDHYGKKCRSRIRSLAIPYLIYTTAILSARFAYQSMTQSIAALNGNSDNDIAFHWLVFPHTWLLAPGHLWFVHDLMLLVLIAPFVYVLSEYRWVVIGLMSLWFMDWQPLPFLEGMPLLNQESLAFFCLGASLTRRGLPQIRSWSRGVGYGLIAVWLGLFVVRFWQSPLSDLTPHSSIFDQSSAFFFYKCSILIGIVLIWLWADRLERQQSLLWLSQFSFVLYIVHTPLTVFLGKILSIVGLSGITLFFARFLATFLVSFAGIYFLYRYVPILYRLISGGRGRKQEVSFSKQGNEYYMSDKWWRKSDVSSSSQTAARHFSQIK